LRRFSSPKKLLGFIAVLMPSIQEQDELMQIAPPIVANAGANGHEQFHARLVARG
jgi:hypothetical protein